jgi:hypothetical protein
MNRVGTACLAAWVFAAACGGGSVGGGDARGPEQGPREASSTTASDGGTCSAQLPSLASVVGEEVAARAAEGWSASSTTSGGGGQPAPPPPRPNCGLALATERAACNAQLATDNAQCDAIYWQCVAWPLVRCWAIPTCTADWTACVNSAATTNRMCLNLATTHYNKCVAAGGIP